MGLAAVRDLRELRAPTTEEDLASFETDVLSGFVLARASAGLVDSTIRNDTNHLELIRDWFTRPLWEMQETDADTYFGKVLRDAKPSTRAGRAAALTVFFQFLELRHKVELHNLTGRVNAFKRVTGKENILFLIAEAALAKPDDAVREVVFPAVSDGEQTLRELVHEFKTKGPVYRRTVQTTLRASYTGHYRRGLIALLDVLEFRSSNTAHRPVIDALTLIKRYAKTANLTYYPLGETVPAHRGATGEWSPA